LSTWKTLCMTQRHKAEASRLKWKRWQWKILNLIQLRMFSRKKGGERKEIFLLNISITKFFQLKTVAHASFLINFHYAFIHWTTSSESNLFKCEPWKRANKLCRRNAANHFLQKTQGMWKTVERESWKAHNSVTVHHRGTLKVAGQSHSWMFVDWLFERGFERDSRVFTQIKVN
jgi:hypothetical protein